MESVIFLPDIHVPYHDQRTMDAVLKYIDDVKVDRIVQIGDFMDFDCISSHNHGKLRLTEGKRLDKDYKEGRKLLSQIKQASYGSKIVILEGNHDERVQRYIDQHPETEGMIEVPVGLELAKNEVEWIPYWSNKKNVLRIGHALFIHGLYTNEFHAKKHVSNFGESVFYGHTHDFQLHSKVMQGDNKTIVGQSLGCLCKYDQEYLRGAPTKWQQGFAHFYFRDKGFYNYYPIMIFDHKFIGPNGREYKG
jgi:predicted phosphodiesterase